MAKYKKRYSSSKLPDPLNTIVDLAGAAIMGAYAKNRIKRDFAKGEGSESLAAATAVFGTGAMRRGSAGIINLGGLYGVNSALRDIEKDQSVSNCRNKEPKYGDAEYDYSTPNDNHYAWRLNCADGSEYGIMPEDYETRGEYNEAIKRASSTVVSGAVKNASSNQTAVHSASNKNIESDKAFVLYRVSRLDNGKNQYFRSKGALYEVGDAVIIPNGNDGTATGIILSVEPNSSLNVQIDEIVGKVHGCNNN